MKKIIYTRADGGISIVTPCISIDDVGMTEAQSLARAISKLPPKASTHRVVEESEIPTDREFRNAWEDKNGSITINESKRQQIVAAKAAKER